MNSYVPSQAPAIKQTGMKNANLKWKPDGSLSAVFRGFELTTEFQPACSFSHSCVIGSEGLLRIKTEEGLSIRPDLFFKSLDLATATAVDNLSIELHAANFCLGAANQTSWLFINLSPRGSDTGLDRQVFEQLLRQAQALQVMGCQLVVEIVEAHVEHIDQYRNAISDLRQAGAMIALDDFGKASSNLDRVLHLSPEIVKLDRQMLLSTSDCFSPRALKNLVAMLQQSESHVLIEGVETEPEALMALNSGADFAQGYYFARPHAPFAEPKDIPQKLKNLWIKKDEAAQLAAYTLESILGPIKESICRAARTCASNVSLVEAASDFFEQPGATRLYLMDADGNALPNDIPSPASLLRTNTRSFPNLSRLAAHTNAAVRPIIRQALDKPGQAYVSTPYLSTSFQPLRITIACSYKSRDGVPELVCGDVELTEETLALFAEL